MRRQHFRASLTSRFPQANWSRLVYAMKGPDTVGVELSHLAGGLVFDNWKRFGCKSCCVLCLGRANVG